MRREIRTRLIERILIYLQTPEYFTCFHTKFQIHTGSKPVEQALRFLHENPVKMTRQEIGTKLGYNGNYLNRLFIEHLGTSLTDYNRQIYLKHAAERLLNSKDSIAKIAEDTGFESRSSFYLQFQNKYGVTPQLYRSVRTDGL